MYVTTEFALFSQEKKAKTFDVWISQATNYKVK